MRTTIAFIVTVVALTACGKGAEQAIKESEQEAAKEQAAKVAAGGAAKKISPPVPGNAKLDCSTMLKADLMTQALGEVEPVTIVEATGQARDADATGSCSVLRGGKPLDAAGQKAKLKKEGRLGVMGGEELCNISAFCWTIEDPERFRKKCAQMKEKDDESLGFYSCVLVVAQGVNDVNRHRFFDSDTKCIIQVRGGPSNVDNDLIGKCAKAAHDLIGPDEIKVTAAAAGSGT